MDYHFNPYFKIDLYNKPSSNKFNNQSFLFFTRVSSNKGYSYKNYYDYYYDHSDDFKMHFNLLDDKCISAILQTIPRNLTINTEKGSCKFNLKLLIETSQTISDFIEGIPQNLEFNLDINDDRNVLNKFEKLYQGYKVVFEQEDLTICQNITKKLLIMNCPNYMKPEELWIKEEYHSIGLRNNELEEGVQICGLNNYFKSIELQTFSIKTKKREYKCNIFGIYSSNVVRDFVEKNPKERQFLFDYEDENEEFQFVCDFLNFEKVTITIKNIYSIKEIVEILQIKYLLDGINDFLRKTEKVSQKIDEQQKIVDSIDELFDLLYNIKEKTVETVKESIIESEWIETEENVQELAAFILQVAKTDILLHPYLVDLLIQLKNEANKSNYLNILTPFIVSKSIYYITPGQVYKININNRYIFDNDDRINTLLFPFIYKLYRKGIIPKDEIISSLKHYNYYNININCWFLPLLIEINPKCIDEIQNNGHYDDDKFLKFINTFIPDKIDIYEQILDNGEPDDAITKALRVDDVDTLQLIITSYQINVKTSCIPFNIFDTILLKNKVNYLNYAAAYGSVKCFKYLLLNYGEIDSQTFEFAVYGGNNEIIKIVEQNYPITENKHDESFLNQILYSIKKHRNNLFDWILEKKTDISDAYHTIASESAINGNIHPLIKIIDKGFDVYTNYTYIIENASKNGFYKFLKFFLLILEQKQQLTLSNSYQSFYVNSIRFGNLSIFKLFKDRFGIKELDSILCFAIYRNYINIINYIFEGIIKREIEMENISILHILSYSLIRKTDDFFIFLSKQIKKICPIINFANSLLMDLLKNACILNNFEAVKTITNMILNNNENEDFSPAYIAAIKENLHDYCKYFIEKKVFINFNEIFIQNVDLSSLDVDFFSFIMSKVDHEMEVYIPQILDKAIYNKNKDLIEYLFNEFNIKKCSLFTAINTRDLDIINIILKHINKPSFINEILYNETVLNKAISMNELQIVKRLLSIPGINPGICTLKLKPALILAIDNLNLEIINAILDFYGDSIQYETYQLQNAIKIIHKLYVNLNKNDQDQKILNVINRILEIKYIDPNDFYEIINKNKTRDYSDSDSDSDSNSDNKSKSDLKEYPTLLLYACKNNDVNFVNKLLQLDKINVNIFSRYQYNTPLIVAIKNKFVSIAELLIKYPKTNINHINEEGKTALIYSITNQLEHIFDLLINDKRFDPDKSRLDYAFLFTDFTFAKKLLSIRSLDVNYCHSFYSTKLVKSVRSNDTEMIDLIINHPSFDKNKSFLKIAIIISIENRNFEIFTKLLRIENNDVNIRIFSGESLLYFAIYFSNINVFDFILNDEKFDWKKNDILQSFVDVYSSNKHFDFLINEDENSEEVNLEEEYSEEVNLEEEDIEEENLEKVNSEEEILEEENNNEIKNKCISDKLYMMDKLYSYDIKHDHVIDFHKLLSNGKSFFTSFSHDFLDIEQIVNFLLKHGVDPNAPDANGVFPLEKAIELNSYGFVLSLINSNTIDYTVKIPLKNDSYTCMNIYTTYLHLAAKSITNRIPLIFLQRNLIDVNITDDLGNTPLMTAVINGQPQNLDCFFEKDNLDYLHKNLKGEDALSILYRKYNESKRKSINNKNEYLEVLKNYLPQNHHYYYG